MNDDLYYFEVWPQIFFEKLFRRQKKYLEKNLIIFTNSPKKIDKTKTAGSLNIRPLKDHSSWIGNEPTRVQNQQLVKFKLLLKVVSCSHVIGFTFQFIKGGNKNKGSFSISCNFGSHSNKKLGFGVSLHCYVSTIYADSQTVSYEHRFLSRKLSLISVRCLQYSEIKRDACSSVLSMLKQF